MGIEWPRRDHRPRGKGGQRPRHDDAASGDSAIAGTSQARASDSPARSGRWLRPRGVAARIGPQVSECQSRVVLAICVSTGTSLGEFPDRRAGAAPCSRIPCSKGSQAGRTKGRADQAGHKPHVSSFVRHALVGRRLPLSHGAGVARPRGRADDDDLHARIEPMRTRRSQSRRRTGPSPR